MIITPDSQDHWLQLRTQDVTSTESAALFGMSPYVTQFELWHRKKSGEQPEFKTNERMRWGNRLEAAIAHTNKMTAAARKVSAVLRKPIDGDRWALAAHLTRLSQAELTAWTLLNLMKNFKTKDAAVLAIVNSKFRTPRRRTI
jgi:predicted phage-related endonuclease